MLRAISAPEPPKPSRISVSRDGSRGGAPRGRMGAGGAPARAPPPAGTLEAATGPPQPLRTAVRMAESRAGRAALGAAAAAGVRHMAHRFIVGSSPEDAAGDLRSMWRDGVGSSLH